MPLDPAVSVVVPVVVNKAVSGLAVELNARADMREASVDVVGAARRADALETTVDVHAAAR